MFKDFHHQKQNGNATGFEWSRVDEASQSVSKIMMAAQKVANSVISGEHALKRSGQGERFWQFRQYDPSDRPQDIDWRQTAKHDSIHVREKEIQRAQIFQFWCKTGESMYWKGETGPSRPDKLSVALIITLALANVAKNNGEMIKLIEKQGRGGRSDETFHEMGMALLKEDSSFGKKLPSFMHIEKSKNCFPVLAGDFIEEYEDIEHSVKSLSQQSSGGVIIQVLDPDEITLPYSGRVLFESVDTLDDEEDIPNVRDIRQEYIRKFEDHRQKIENLAKNAGWYYFIHITQDPVAPLLQKLWHYVSDQRNMSAHLNY